MFGSARSFSVGADAPNTTSSAPNPPRSGGFRAYEDVFGQRRSFSGVQGRVRVAEDVVGPGGDALAAGRTVVDDAG